MSSILSFALAVWVSHPAAAQTAPPGFQVESYGGSLAGGTALAWTPDGRLLVARKNGDIRVLKNGALLPTPFHDLMLNVPAGNDRGLLGIAVAPDFASSGQVYVYFTAPTPAPHNCIRRLQASASDPDVSDGTETAVVDLENLGSDTMHNGGAIHFGPDGKLYVAVGENADASLSQSLSSRFGKLLRYEPDGSIPPDNPISFQGVSGAPTGEYRAIWAMGLRNPFRFAFQPGTGRLYINDVGVDRWEEINEGGAGLNYGWEGGLTDGPRNLTDFTDPLFVYGHTGPAPTGSAITGGVFYNPSTVQFPSSYVGLYFFADYAAGFIRSLDPGAPQASSPFLSGASGLVDLQVGPDGGLYYLGMGSNPGVYRVSYASPSAGGGGGASSGGGVTPATAVTSDRAAGKRCGATGLELLVLPILPFLLRRRFSGR
ncbi:MAG: PQQ-dependent sugar dehydrogenase [Planctomycetaceae bacterium]|nr:PQQ-dependent sugar dehydrogenase [Planctomycetaceae bacterium]